MICIYVWLLEKDLITKHIHSMPLEEIIYTCGNFFDSEISSVRIFIYTNVHIWKLKMTVFRFTGHKI
jgi:hypothetical protein